MAQPVTEPAQASDLEAIRRAALDYVQGWYEGDAERVRRSLHPDFIKRGFIPSDDSVIRVSRTLTPHMFIAMTEEGGGTPDVPPERRSYDITLVDAAGEIASAKVISAEYVDYLHLAHWEGHWVIVNVLWTFRAPGRS